MNRNERRRAHRRRRKQIARYNAEYYAKNKLAILLVRVYGGSMSAARKAAAALWPAD